MRPRWPISRRRNSVPSRARRGVAAASWSTCPTWSIAARVVGRASSDGPFAARSHVCTTAGASWRSSLLSLTFALILSGMMARGEAGGADARAYWAGVRIWLNGGDPYHPTGPFLPYVYAPWMLPLFTPWAALPVGRRLVRLAGRHDPAAALDDRLGVPPPPADDGGQRGRPRLPVRGQPRHRQHQPAADPDALGRAVHRSAPRRPALGARHVDEVGPGGPLVHPATPDPGLGTRLACRLDRAQPGHPAA